MSRSLSEKTWPPAGQQLIVVANIHLLSLKTLRDCRGNTLFHTLINWVAHTPTALLLYEGQEGFLKHGWSAEDHYSQCVIRIGQSQGGGKDCIVPAHLQRVNFKPES